MPLTQKSLTIEIVTHHALRKRYHDKTTDLTPIEIAALMEDAILSEQDGIMSKDDLRASLNEYGDMLTVAIRALVPERK